MVKHDFFFLLFQPVSKFYDLFFVEENVDTIEKKMDGQMASNKMNVYLDCLYLFPVVGGG